MAKKKPKPIDIDAVAEAERFGALAIGPKRFRTGKRRRAMTPNERWASDRIQFPRLLAEIDAAGISSDCWNRLRESMDLDDAQINELFDRAQVAWEAIKAEP